MKRILLIGNSPLPSENTKSRPAAGLRTFQFLDSLLNGESISNENRQNAFSAAKSKRYKIVLVTIAMPECYDDKPGKKEIRHSDDFLQLQIAKDDPKLVAEIQRLHDEFHPEAIIAVNTHSAYIASKVQSLAHFWADLNGWIMAEGQAQAFRLEHDDFLLHYRDMELSVLERADKVSTVSEAQKFAVMGEMATLGRLSKETFNYNFIEKITNTTQLFSGEETTKKGREDAAKVLDKIPDDGFKILWLGGYNTWADEVTLFKALEKVFAEEKEIYFVSTGGKIEGLNSKNFENLLEMVKGSKFKKRFQFLGWVKTSEIPYIYEKCDLGINVDKKCVETLTGARNRLNEMMKFGLPIVTTEGSEVAYEVAACGAGRVAASGDADKLAEEILHLYKDRQTRHGYKLKEMSEKGQEYTAHGYANAMQPLHQWLANPRPAPDSHLKRGRGGFGVVALFKAGWRYLRQNGIKKTFRKVRQRVFKF